MKIKPPMNKDNRSRKTIVIQVVIGAILYVVMMWVLAGCPPL